MVGSHEKKKKTLGACVVRKAVALATTCWNISRCSVWIGSGAVVPYNTLTRGQAGHGLFMGSLYGPTNRDGFRKRGCACRSYGLCALFFFFLGESVIYERGHEMREADGVLGDDRRMHM
jgi:hypothetical protein